MEKPQSNISNLLKPYARLVAGMVALAVAINCMTLVVPKLVSHAIDAFLRGTFVLNVVILEFGAVAFGVFLLTYLQGVVQTYASERVARDLRNELTAKISRQTYSYIQSVTPSALLTNLTSDIDGIKLFISQAIVALVSSVLLVVGSGVILLSINWRLALAVLAIFPIIAGTFFTVFSRVRVLFKQAQEVIDWLNKVINESIFGAALVRVLNAQQIEFDKFVAANTKAKDIGMQILRLFAGLIPIISFVANFGMLIILVLGGKFIIDGNMTLGDFAAFNSYVSLMIFPIFVMGFMSTVIAQATASYARIRVVLDAPEREETGTSTARLSGDIVFDDVSLLIGDKPVLKNLSFHVAPGSKVAIIGPTAAGKTQILHLLTGLMYPTGGTIRFDGNAMETYQLTALHEQIGFVFQDSVMFNLSLRDNIAFSAKVTEEDVRRATATAELSSFIATLPSGLDTMVSERGTSLSGGQKQRVMLARALALNPKILVLDDFTARVDGATEAKILANIAENYPHITIISVTQKIASIEHYDQILLLMEGELLASGTHKDLMTTSPEYVQIFNSQQSTSTYELQPE